MAISTAPKQGLDPALTPATQQVDLDGPDESMQGDVSALSGVARMCYDLYTEYSSSSYRHTKLDERTENRKRYKGERDAKSFPFDGCSNISVMLDAIAVDNLEPRLLAQLIAEDEDFVHPRPVEESDAEQTDYVKRFFNWALLSNMTTFDDVSSGIRDLLLDGTWDIIPIWQETRTTTRIRTIRPVYVDPEGRRVELPPELAQLPPQQLATVGLAFQGMEDTYDERPFVDFRVKLEAVPLSDSFCPDTGEPFDTQPYLRLIYPRYRDLVEQSGDDGPYKNITPDLVVDPGRRSADHPDEAAEALQIQPSEHSREVTVLECYLPPGYDTDEWTIASYAIERGWVEVRRQPVKDVYWHGKKPVHRMTIFRESNESMGTGVPQKIRHFSTGIDDLFNQMIDSGTVQIVPWFFYNRAAGSHNLQLKVAPGRGIEVPKNSNVTFPALGASATQFLTFIEALLGFFERLISLSDYTLGRESGTAGKGGETYSGMALIVQEGNIKHQHDGKRLRTRFEALLKDVYTLYAQNTPLGAKMSLFQNDAQVFEPIDIGRLQGNYDMRIQVADSSANKMLNRREAVEKFQLLGASPVANIVKVTEDLLKAYGHRQTGEYIKPEVLQLVQAVTQAPEVVEVVGQFLQQKAQQEQDAMVANQAQQNIRRQEIERQVEAPLENRKIFDQAVEGAKRAAAKPVAEEIVAAQMEG